jgi:ABC-2 type transport system permease protein
MQKMLVIAWKDLLIRAKDRAGLAFLLLVPLVIISIMGFAFGGGNGEPEITIPVAVVNQDAGFAVDDFASIAPQAYGLPPALSSSDFFSGFVMPTEAALPEDGFNFGDILVEQVLPAEGLRDLLAVTVVADEASAVANGEDYCCVVVLPQNLTRAILLGEPSHVRIESDPAHEISGQIVESIFRQIVKQFHSGSVLFSVSLAQLAQSGRMASAGDFAALIATLGGQVEQMFVDNNAGITLETRSAADEEITFDPMSFFVPSMAIMFLAFGASQGVRSILAEEEMGTFRRLNAGPLSAYTVLSGKLLAAFLAGAVQFAILLGAGVVFFNVQWGNPQGVVVFSIFVLLAFTCLGLVLAVIARSQGQANTLSTTVLLVFSVVGGNLAPASNFPAWMQPFAQFTPNYWGMSGFTKLGLGEPLGVLQPEIVALATMSLILLIAGVLLYRRRVQL